MNARLVSKSLGAILGYIGVVVLLPIVFALFSREFTEILPYIAASLVAFVLGLLFSLKKVKTQELDNIKKLDALAIVFFSWLFFGIVCSVPYLFYNLGPVDAFFESCSGITSTGSTIFTDFSLYPKTLFFFRSMTQWLGGMGIVVLFVAILPKFAIAGRQVFFTEVPGPVDENITPRVRHSATWLWAIYISLTIIQILMLKFIGGMDFYNAICNAFSTMSSGGFSPNPYSIMGYNSMKVTWIIILFMFIAGMNFILLYRVFIQGKFESFFKGEEFKAYLGISLFLGVSIGLVLWLGGGEAPFKALTDGIYQVVSLITSTGSCSADYTLWKVDAKVLLFAALFVGGCAASTSGGIKVARWVVLFKYLRREIAKIIHPQAIYPVKLERKSVGDDAISQMIAFIIFYISIFALSTFLVALIEGNATIAVTGSITTLGNAGPGFGTVIGPLGSFSSLSDATKLIFIFNMLVGRLELIPFLALLHPDMWRKY